MAVKASSRVLTEDQRRKLEDNMYSNVVSDFKQNKLEKEAQKIWDLFCKRNTTNFFKDTYTGQLQNIKELFFDNCEVSKLIFDRHMDQ